MALRLTYAEHDGFLLDVFNHYFEMGSYMDVQFVCKGNKVTWAHKLVVASVSPLVRKLIAETSHKDEVMTIYLPDVNSNILSLFLTFLYEGVMKLDVSELGEFKVLCNLLCVDIPNAEISEVPRESVSPPRVPPTLAQRISSHSRTPRPIAPKKVVTQTALPKTPKTFTSNVTQANLRPVVVKQEKVDDTGNPANHTVASSSVGYRQIQPDIREKINTSNRLSSSTGTPGNQVDFEAEKRRGDLNKPTDISERLTASDGVMSLAISNVVSLSGGTTKRSCGQKRKYIPIAPAEPKKQANQSLPSVKN